MAHEHWTVDRLHVALLHSASRQQLLQDVNLTPIENLPAVLDGWAAAAEQLESARPRIEAARAHMKTCGVLPDDQEARGRHRRRVQGRRAARGQPGRPQPGSGVTYRLNCPADVFDTYK
ncbi:hypothetical protein ACWF2L_38410 [Streptomyces anulatus]